MEFEIDCTKLPSTSMFQIETSSCRQVISFFVVIACNNVRAMENLNI
jgi:hypothetical protein